MELYILRHGDAVDRVTGGYARDEDRPLTEQGREEARLAGGALAALGVRPDLLLVSPLVRARQTAELAAEALRPRRGPLESAALAPGGRPEEVLAALRGAMHGEGASGAGSALLVGHMPDLGELVGWLVWGQLDLAVPLRTGGVCRVDLPDQPAPSTGDLRWLLPPRLLRRLS